MKGFFRSRRLAFALRLFVGVVLIYASHDKLGNPQAFADAIGNYRILPDSLVNLAAVTLPWLELFTGLALILGLAAPGAGLVASGLFAVFTAALVSAIARGLDIECGCFKLEAGSRISYSDIWLRAGLLVASVQIMLASTFTDWPLAWFTRARKDLKGE